MPWKARDILLGKLNEHREASVMSISRCLATFIFKRKLKPNKIVL